MYTLFEGPAEPLFPRYTPPNWSNVRTQLRRNLTRIQSYYGRQTYAVNAKHLLAKMIIAAALPTRLEAYRYYINAQRVSIDTTGALFLTSSTNWGRIQRGNFYNCPEVITVDYSEFDYDAVQRDWRNAKAVRVLYHPYMDLNMSTPDAKYYPASDKVAYISINMAMLLVQYRAFCQEEEALATSLGIPARNVYQFLAMHVLPNMLNSHVDVALLNRTLALAEGVVFPESDYMHSVFVPFVTDKVDACLELLLAYSSKVTMRLNDLQACLPTVGYNNGVSATVLPDNVDTRQLRWAYVLSRVPYMRLMTLMTIKTMRGQTALGREVNELRNILMRLERDGSLRQVMSGQLLDTTVLDLDDLLNLLTS